MNTAVFFYFLVLAMGKRGSLKRRLNDESGDEPVARAEPSGSAAQMGGIRMRHNQEPSSSSGGVATPDLPFTKLLKRRWAEGQASSPDVQEYALAASQQGELVMTRFCRIGSWAVFSVGPLSTSVRCALPW